MSVYQVLFQCENVVLRRASYTSLSQGPEQDFVFIDGGILTLEEAASAFRLVIRSLDDSDHRVVIPYDVSTQIEGKTVKSEGGNFRKGITKIPATVDSSRGPELFTIKMGVPDHRTLHANLSRTRSILLGIAGTFA